VKDPLLDLPGYSLRRAASAMMAEFAARIEPLGLRIADVSALLVIGANPGVTASQLGRALDIQRANMVPLLNRIEDVGLLTRRPLDGKSHSLHLTEAGEAKLAEARAKLSKVDIALNRQSAQLVRAPRDGRVLSLNTAAGATLISAGDLLATIAPERQQRVVELLVDGRDAALVRKGQPVRLNFEGWPAIQFSGWPSRCAPTTASCTVGSLKGSGSAATAMSPCASGSSACAAAASSWSLPQGPISVTPAGCPSLRAVAGTASAAMSKKLTKFV